MLLKQTIIGENRGCGLILKPFEEPWTFTPRFGRWIVIPLDYVNFDDELDDGDYFVVATETNQYYDVFGSVTIIGPAILILVILDGDGNPLGWAVSSYTDHIIFDRTDLYTYKRGISLNRDITFTNKNIAISSFFRFIDIFNGELNNAKPTFKIGHGFEIEKSSGIKSGQFIL